MGKKRNLTPEQRKAIGERLKKAREAKDAQTASHAQAEKNESVVEDTSVEETISVSQYQDLLRQIQEMKAAGFDELLKKSSESKPAQTASITNQGVVGLQEKYSVSPDDYPSPVEELSSDPRLARFAFRENYELDYRFTTSQYETKDNRNVIEPKFHLQLNRIKYDEAG